MCRLLCSAVSVSIRANLQWFSLSQHPFSYQKFHLLFPASAIGQSALSDRWCFHGDMRFLLHTPIYQTCTQNIKVYSNNVDTVYCAVAIWLLFYSLAECLLKWSSSRQFHVRLEKAVRLFSVWILGSSVEWLTTNEGMLRNVPLSSGS